MVSVQQEVHRPVFWLILLTVVVQVLRAQLQLTLANGYFNTEESVAYNWLLKRRWSYCSCCILEY